MKTVPTPLPPYLCKCTFRWSYGSGRNLLRWPEATLLVDVRRKRLHKLRRTGPEISMLLPSVSDRCLGELIQPAGIAVELQLFSLLNNLIHNSGQCVYRSIKCH